ncbi:MAG: type II secretion system protein N [Gammaproteobacteria bacterium]|nr:type II secretion system protein N [Gammaproteobacteria bacterium]
MKRWWIVLGIVAMIVIVVVMIPARAYSMILENYGTHLRATKGTIWYGSGDVTVAGKNIGRLKWHFRPIEIFTGKLAFNVTMQNQNIHLAGVLKRRISSTEFQGATTLAHSHVNKVLLPYEIVVEGDFEINDLSVKINDKRQLEILTGSISWEGGTSRYRADDETRVFEMPAVAGKLTHADGFAVLNAHDQEKNFPLITIRFQPESGLFESALTQHMLELSQMPLDSSADPSAVVLEVSRELY